MTIDFYLAVRSDQIRLLLGSTIFLTGWIQIRFLAERSISDPDQYVSNRIRNTKYEKVLNLSTFCIFIKKYFLSDKCC